MYTECILLDDTNKVEEAPHKYFVLFKVLSVVRSNYDTLTLKLIESLESYQKYSEAPKETAFFTQLVGSPKYHSGLLRYTLY